MSKDSFRLNSIHLKSELFSWRCQWWLQHTHFAKETWISPQYWKFLNFAFASETGSYFVGGRIMAATHTFLTCKQHTGWAKNVSVFSEVRLKKFWWSWIWFQAVFYWNTTCHSRMQNSQNESPWFQAKRLLLLRLIIHFQPLKLWRHILAQGTVACTQPLHVGQGRCFKLKSKLTTFKKISNHYFERKRLFDSTSESQYISPF